jgi:AraC-like DNA-binding protein
MPKMVSPSAVCREGFSECGSVDELVAKDRITLGFRHLDVMVAIGTEESPQGGLTAGRTILHIERLRTEFGQLTDVDRFLRAIDKSDCVEGVLHALAVESSSDPIVIQLCSALTAAKGADDRETEVYADAVGLAIIARLICLQSEAQQSTQCAFGLSDSSAKRKARALQKWRLKRVIEYVDKHLDQTILLSNLAAVAGLSRMHFAAQFRAATNLRPRQYLLKRRIERAEELLRQSAMTLVEISLAVGFQTQSHFTTVFKRFTGHTPHRWRLREEDCDSPSVMPTEQTAMRVTSSSPSVLGPSRPDLRRGAPVHQPAGR